MRATLYVLSATILFVGCARAPRDAPPRDYWSLPPLQQVAIEEAAGAPVLVAMSRTGCFGSCPVYRIVVRMDGQVEYFGGFNVAQTGAASERLKPQQLTELRNVLARANLADLDLSRWRCPHGYPDEPGVELIAPLSGLRKSICYPTGGDSPPQYLKTLTLGGLDIKVDLIVGTEQWTGHRPVYRESGAEG